MNNIKLTGTVISDLEYAYTLKKSNEKVYKFAVSSLRTSEKEDVLPCYVSELNIKNLEIKQGDKIDIMGHIRTRNTEEHKLLIFVWVTYCEPSLPFNEDMNVVNFSNCVICKMPKYRTTPTGRSVTDLILASDRISSDASDYIPTICWGRYANAASCLDIADRISGTGRLQSRAYMKKLEDGSTEERVAYELSVINFNLDKEESEVLEDDR